MTKEEILAAKKLAENRKNRRLSNEEANIIMNLSGYKEKTESKDEKTLNIFNANEKLVKTVKRKERLITPKSVKKIETVLPDSFLVNLFKNEINKIEERRKDIANGNLKPNRRLTKKQFSSLSKKIIDIGINEDKHEIIDLNIPTKYSNEDIIKLCLEELVSNGVSDAKEQYKSLTKNKKLKYADKLSIVSYILKRKFEKKYIVGESGDKVKKNIETPFCLIPKNQRVDGIRNECLGLKKKGDIFNPPFRILPNDEYIKECQGKRTKFDAFDKLDINDKIQWARYATLALDINVSDKLCVSKLKEKDCERIVFAMKYSCKMMNIPEFKGSFMHPLWILYRIDKFYREMTEKESKVFFDMTFELLGINNKTIPIIDAKAAIKKVEPMLKEFNLYEQFKEKTNNSCSYCKKLKIATDLLLDKKS